MDFTDFTKDLVKLSNKTLKNEKVSLEGKMMGSVLHEVLT